MLRHRNRPTPSPSRVRAQQREQPTIISHRIALANMSNIEMEEDEAAVNDAMVQNEVRQHQQHSGSWCTRGTLTYTFLDLTSFKGVQKYASDASDDRCMLVQ